MPTHSASPAGQHPAPHIPNPERRHERALISVQVTELRHQELPADAARARLAGDDATSPPRRHLNPLRSRIAP